MLTNTERLFEGRVLGPESMAVDSKGKYDVLFDWVGGLRAAKYLKGLSSEVCLWWSILILRSPIFQTFHMSINVLQLLYNLLCLHAYSRFEHHYILSTLWTKTVTNIQFLVTISPLNNTRLTEMITNLRKPLIIKKIHLLSTLGNVWVIVYW